MILFTVVKTKTTKKKRKSETGAAKVIWLTHGPGLSLRGMTIPILTPESRLLYCHFNSHPLASCVFCVGERLLCGKSIWSKSVRISSEKVLIVFTSLPKSYHHSSIPCDPYPTSTVSDCPGASLILWLRAPALNGRFDISFPPTTNRKLS